MNNAASLSQKLLETTAKALSEDHGSTILAKIGSKRINLSSDDGFRGILDLGERLSSTRDSQRVLGNEHPTMLHFYVPCGQASVAKETFS